MPYPWEIQTAPANIRAIVERVAQKVGVTPVPDVLTDWSLAGVRNAYTTSRRDNAGKRVYGLFLPPDPLTLFTMDDLLATIAHELGHIAHNDNQRLSEVYHRQEFEADDFAVEHGYGPTMLKTYEAMKAEIPDDSETHPSMPKRIARIKQHMRIAK